jgi:hypothetical protein
VTVAGEPQRPTAANEDADADDCCIVAAVRLDADVDLTRVFAPEQFSRGLESWSWVGIGNKVPAFTSLFGDVFFRSDDGVWLLDTLEGSLTRPWDSADALKAELGTPDGQDQYLLAGLALSAERRGIVPDAGQVYGFKMFVKHLKTQLADSSVTSVMALFSMLMREAVADRRIGHNPCHNIKVATGRARKGRTPPRHRSTRSPSALSDTRIRSWSSPLRTPACGGAN